MFTELVAAGTSAYRRSRRKPSLGLILASNGHDSPTSQHDVIAALEQGVQPAFAALDRFQDRYINPMLDDAYAMGAAFANQHIAPLLVSSRSEHLLFTPSADDPNDISSDERATNRNIVLGAGAFVCNTIGALLYSPLMLLSVPSLALITIYYWRTAYMQVVHQRRVTFDVLIVFHSSGLLLLGSFWVLSFYVLIFQSSFKAVYKTRDRSRKRLVNILGEMPRFVWLERNGKEVQIPFETLQIGDQIIVQAGEQIPVDGTITSGIVSIDQHMLTGEAQPAEKTVGDAVYAGTIVLSGTLTIQVEQAGSDTVAAQIGAVLNRTADYRATLELRGKAIADNSVLPMLGLGAITTLLLGPTSGVAVILASIGAQTQFTGPISVLNFLNIASDHSLLVKDGRALELVKTVDTVVFDKTGTLTQEQPHVGAIHPANGYTATDVLTFAAAAEHKQPHPIARAIVQEATHQQLTIPPINDAAYEVGYGLKVQINDTQVRVGSGRFMQHEAIAIPPAIQAVQQECHDAGQSLVYVAVDSHLAGAIELHPTIRPEARRIIRGLQQRGLEVVIISGDHAQPTRKLAQELGIVRFFAEVLPEEKASLIDRLQAEGRTVCFVGDGINDSIGLKKAQVSVSLRGATTIAIDTAQIILTDKSLRQLVTVFDLADQLDVTMQRNLLFATLPGSVNVFGVYLFGTGLLNAACLSWLGLTIGMTNAMLPMIQHWQHRSLVTNSRDHHKSGASPF